MTSLYASEIAGLFSNPERDVTELFPGATYAHLTGFCAVRAATSAATSVRFENKDSL
jgi:hypothetical protein